MLVTIDRTLQWHRAVFLRQHGSNALTHSMLGNVNVT